jgi:prophage antirepressor-like protein
LEILPFNYKNHNIRTLLDEKGDIWFVAKDVITLLQDNINPNVGQATKDLDSDELTSFKIMSGGQTREMAFISESGLYSLIIRSRKQIAKPFQRWVTRKVLPSIRKTGSYSLSELPNFSEILSQNEEAKKLVELFEETKPFHLLLLQKLLKENSVSSLFQLDLSNSYFLPTELGKLHGLSGRETNLLLESKGFQVSENGIWKLTESGKEFGMEIGGTYHQLKWKLETPLFVV